MQITFLDDSFPYDGATPERQPLGGAERGLIGLAVAMAARGHQVSVINRCESAAEIDGVQWLPWDTPRPPETDVLVALRRPSLLGEIEAEKRYLWAVGSAAGLARAELERHLPILLFRSSAQRQTWHEEGIACTVLEPGVAEAFRAPPENEPFEPPRVVVTTHPLAGLDGLLDAWVDGIYRKCPEASLHIHSMALARGASGGVVDDDIRPIFHRVRAAEPQNVIIERPGTEPQMAAAYRASRLHLYPAMADGADCATLADSQACGLPAVALDCAAVRERLANGETGFVVPDRDALVNVAVQIIQDGAVHQRLREAALQRVKRSWDDAAADFEALL